MTRFMARLTGRIIARDMEKCGLGTYCRGSLKYDRRKWTDKEECVQYIMWVYKTTEQFASYIVE